MTKSDLPAGSEAAPTRTIVVTGGASGLGAAITRRLAVDPSNLVHFTFHRSAAAAAALTAAHPNVHAHPLDFADEASLQAFLATLDRLAPDVLVNNAVGGLLRKPAHKLTAAELAAGFALNVAPVVALSHRALALFRKRRGGRLVTVLSDALVGSPPLGLAAYAAEKAYLASLARSWAAENAAYGVASNCVLPTMMATGLNADLDPRVVEQVAASLPAGRLPSVEEVAEAVAFFVTCPAAINGARLVVNDARVLD